SKRDWELLTRLVDEIRKDAVANGCGIASQRLPYLEYPIAFAEEIQRSGKKPLHSKRAICDSVKFENDVSRAIVIARGPIELLTCDSAIVIANGDIRLGSMAIQNSIVISDGKITAEGAVNSILIARE